MDDMDSILGQPVGAMDAFMQNPKAAQQVAGHFDQFEFGAGDGALNFGGSLPLNDIGFGLGPELASGDLRGLNDPAFGPNMDMNLLGPPQNPMPAQQQPTIMPTAPPQPQPDLNALINLDDQPNGAGMPYNMMYPLQGMGQPGMGQPGMEMGPLPPDMQDARQQMGPAPAPMDAMNQAGMYPKPARVNVPQKRASVQPAGAPKPKKPRARAKKNVGGVMSPPRDAEVLKGKAYTPLVASETVPQAPQTAQNLNNGASVGTPMNSNLGAGMGAPVKPEISARPLETPVSQVGVLQAPQPLRLRIQILLQLNMELIRLCMASVPGTEVYTLALARLHGNIGHLRAVQRQQNVYSALALPPPNLRPSPRLPSLTVPLRKLEELFQSSTATPQQSYEA